MSEGRGDTTAHLTHSARTRLDWLRLWGDDGFFTKGRRSHVQFREAQEFLNSLSEGFEHKFDGLQTTFIGCVIDFDSGHMAIDETHGESRLQVQGCGMQ